MRDRQWGYDALSSVHVITSTSTYYTIIISKESAHCPFSAALLSWEYVESGLTIQMFHLGTPRAGAERREPCGQQTSNGPVLSCPVLAARHARAAQSRASWTATKEVAIEGFAQLVGRCYSRGAYSAATERPTAGAEYLASLASRGSREFPRFLSAGIGEYNPEGSCEMPVDGCQ